MSKVYLVTYDYKTKPPSFDDFLKELKSFPRWCHYIDSTWLIVSDLKAKEIWCKLKPFITEDVNVLIIEVGKDRAGWQPEKAWDWIRRNVGPNPIS